MPLDSFSMFLSRNTWVVLRDLSANIALRLWLIIIKTLLWHFRRTVPVTVYAAASLPSHTFSLTLDGMRHGGLFSAMNWSFAVQNPVIYFLWIVLFELSMCHGTLDPPVPGRVRIPGLWPWRPDGRTAFSPVHFNFRILKEML
jgi:hypothetical protein